MPQPVYDHPANTSVAAFLGNPRITLHVGSVGLEDGRVTFERGELRSSLSERLSALAPAAGSGTEVAIGIGPEDIAIRL